MVASDGEFVHRLCMKHVAGATWTRILATISGLLIGSKWVALGFGFEFD